MKRAKYKTLVIENMLWEKSKDRDSIFSNLGKLQLTSFNLRKPRV